MGHAWKRMLKESSTNANMILDLNRWAGPSLLSSLEGASGRVRRYQQVVLEGRDCQLSNQL